MRRSRKMYDSRERSMAAKIDQLDMARRLRSVLPPLAVLFFNLSADDVAASFTGGLGNVDSDYAGWAICNGDNGTPDMVGLFPRLAEVAGGTGGSDSSAHDHAIDHDHPAVTSGVESGHTHSTPAHSHQTFVGADATNIYVDRANGAVGTIRASTDKVYVAGTHDTGTNNVEVMATANDGAGTSGASSGHTHSVDVAAIAATSGVSSSSDNRPAFYELVPLMLVA